MWSSWSMAPAPSAGGPLWTQVIITLQNGEITDLRWRRNKAITAPSAERIARGQELLRRSARHSGDQGCEDCCRSADVPNVPITLNCG
jgi:hypothetical protein